MTLLATSFRMHPYKGVSGLGSGDQIVEKPHEISLERPSSALASQCCRGRDLHRSHDLLVSQFRELVVVIKPRDLELLAGAEVGIGPAQTSRLGRI